MNILFVHQNFPGQYLHLARHLAAQLVQRLDIARQLGLAVPGMQFFQRRPCLGPLLMGEVHIRIQVPVGQLGRLVVSHFQGATGLQQQGHQQGAQHADNPGASGPLPDPFEPPTTTQRKFHGNPD